MDANASEDNNVTGSRVRQPSESDEQGFKRQKTLSTSSNEDGYNSQQLGMCAASPPRFVLLEEVINTANELTNMALANEIALNKDFKLEKQNLPEDSVEKRVKDMLHKAYWDILSQEIREDPPNYTRALNLLQEIKENLFDLLLPRHNRLKEQLNENLDMELIKQQSKHGSLDFHKYSKYILSLMGMICAPVRDDQLKKLSKLTDTIEIYKGIMETLHEMKLDMVNFTIQVIRPGIAEYEKDEFKKFLDKSEFTEIEDKLSVTKEWLARNIDRNKPKQTRNEILNNAFVELLKDNFDLLPETMITHMVHFMDIRKKCNNFSIIASVILVTMSAVGSALRDITDFRKQLKNHILLLLPETMSEQEITESLQHNISEQIIKESNDCLTKHGFPLLNKETETLLSGQISELTEPNYNIRKITLERIHGFFKKSISNDKPTRLQIPGGLTSIELELATVAKNFVQAVSHNRAVFDEFYNQIFKSLSV